MDPADDLQLLRLVRGQLFFLCVLHFGKVEEKFQRLYPLIRQRQLLRLVIKGGKDARRVLVAHKERHRFVPAEFPRKGPKKVCRPLERLRGVRRRLPQIDTDGKAGILSGGKGEAGMGAGFHPLQGKIPRVQVDVIPVFHPPGHLPGPAVADL